MLIIKVKEGENIDRALKRYKRKTRNTKLVNLLRENKEYLKKKQKNNLQKHKCKRIRRQ